MSHQHYPTTQPTSTVSPMTTDPNTSKVIRGNAAPIMKHLGTISRALSWVVNHLNSTSRDWLTDQRVDQMLEEVVNVETMLKTVRTLLENRRPTKVVVKEPSNPFGL